MCGSMVSHMGRKRRVGQLTQSLMRRGACHSGEMPEGWENGKIYPIHKADDEDVSGRSG